jgi:hypothetical protein
MHSDDNASNVTLTQSGATARWDCRIEFITKSHLICSSIDTGASKNLCIRIVSRPEDFGFGNRNLSSSSGVKGAIWRPKTFLGSSELRVIIVMSTFIKEIESFTQKIAGFPDFAGKFRFFVYMIREPVGYL